MLTEQTKRRIQNARDVLVGQLPLPSDQVELITIALIYKFMDDIDEESRSLGGKPTFFVGKVQVQGQSVDLRDLNWRNLVSNTLDAETRVQKFAQGIEAISNAKHIPELFKSIFKNTFLKFRDGRILKLFLDEINGFVYDHSEELGNAFEFLLCAMGSQGDNGQFRTPRHIIDFIVDVVDPQKEDTILDPACGTAGFLISAYKHILEANTSPRIDGESTRLGDLLTGAQRKKLTENLVGYDITPLMTRLSRVNMYLHHFPNPIIHEYDTLTNDARWDEKFDCILANPPFMTPRGGISPHNKFRIPANRAEVLFSDYIAEHLTPNGKAGFIVPEGIIFQSQNAYKALRKMLVEEYLWAVVSLPAGVFNPYSGVKTSILLLDRNIARREKEVLFVKVENDGFDLGAQRRPIEANDLPKALTVLKTWKEKKKLVGQTGDHVVERKTILASSDISLSGDRYRSTTVRQDLCWPIVKVSDIAEVNRAACDPEKIFGEQTFVYLDISAVDAAQRRISFSNRIKGSEAPSRARRVVQHGDVLLSTVRPNLRAFVYLDNPPSDAVASTGFAVLTPDLKKISGRFLHHSLFAEPVMNQMIGRMGKGAYPSITQTDVEELEIPLPPLEEQERLVAEFEGYRQIIESARQILTHYKPTFRINPEWPTNQLGEIADFKNGIGYSKENKGVGIKVIGVANFQNHLVAPTEGLDEINPDGVVSEKDLLRDGDIIFVRSNGNKALVGRSIVVQTHGQRLTHSAFTIRLRFGAKTFDPMFFGLLFKDPTYRTQLMGRGANINNLSQDLLRELLVPVPPLAEQRRIVAELEAERALVEANRELAARFEQKLQSRLAEIWGEQPTRTAPNISERQPALAN